MAEGGTLAEESISSVRTAQAFGSQKKLGKLYDGYITSAFLADMKSALWQGGGMGVFFFVIYNAYALGESKTIFPIPSLRLTPI